MRLKTYFNSVIDWVQQTFVDVRPDMKGLGVGPDYSEMYHGKSYDPEEDVGRREKTRQR